MEESYNSNYSTGMTHLVNGNLQQAVDSFTECMNGKYSADAYFYRGMAYKKLGMFRKALDDFLQVHPDNYPQLRSEMQSMQLALGYPILDQENMKIDEETGKITITTKTPYERGKIFFDDKKWIEAIQEFDKAIEPYEAGKPEYVFLRQGVAYPTPEIYNAFYCRAVAKYALNNFRSSLEDWNMVMGCIFGLHPSLAMNPLPQNAAEACYLRGDCKGHLNDVTGAVEDFSKAINLRPNYIKAYFGRAQAFLGLKQFTEAIEDLNIIIEQEPKYDFISNCYLFRAYAKQKMEDFNGGIKDCNSAYEYDKENSGIFITRGFCFFKIGNKEKAMADWKEAVRLGDNVGQQLIDVHLQVRV